MSLAEAVQAASIEPERPRVAVVRRWGDYVILAMGARYKVKILSLRPGAAISLQLHRRRAEHWVVLEGEAEVILGDRRLRLGHNDAVDVPIGVKHRLSNAGTSWLRVIEVQTGTYFGEDDIERFES